MRKLILSAMLIIFAFSANSLSAQVFVANWDDVLPVNCNSSDGVTTESFTNPNQTGLNTSSNVLKFERAGQSNKEAFSLEFHESKLILNPKLTFQIIMPTNGDVLVVLQNDDLNTIAEIETNISASTDWQELIFDFVGTLSPQDRCKRILVYAGYDNVNSNTYLFDNFKFQSGFSSGDAVIALEKFMGSPSDANSFEGYTSEVLNWWGKNGEISNDSIVINRYPNCSWLSNNYIYPVPSMGAVVELGADAEINKTDTLILSNINTEGFTDYQVVISTAGYNSLSAPNVFVRKNNENWSQLTYTALDSVSNQIIQYKLPTGIISANTIAIMLACNSAANGQWIDDIGLLGKPRLVNSIAVSGFGNSVTVGMGTTLKMIYDAAPSNALDTSVVWTVEDGTGSASINAEGILEPISVGTVTVKASANDGSGVVGQKTIAIVEAGSVEISTAGNVTEINSNNGTLQLIATVIPSTASQNVNWSLVDSIDVDTATVSAQGLLTAIRNGMVEVIATTTDGTNLSDTISITLLNQIVEPDTLIIADATITEDNQEVQMQIASTEPHDADISVVWSVDVSDADTASITTGGLLTPKRNGEVKVIAESSIEGVSVSTYKTIQITGQVVNVDSVKITSVATISENDGALELVATVYPVDAINKEVTWSIVSQDADTAILENNVLTAVRNGSVIVKASADDNSEIYDELEVLLTNQVVELEELEVSGSNIDVNGGEMQMEAVLFPEDAEGFDIKWWLATAADSLKATISETGLLTAYRNGSVTVFAQDKITGITASKSIVISEQVMVSEIILTNDADSTITQNKGTLQVYAEVLPAEARIKDIEWSIAKIDGNAEVNANGLVTAKANGKVYVIATAIDDGAYSDSMLIDISGQVMVSEVAIQIDTAYITTNGGELTLNTEVNPTDAADLSLTWSLIQGDNHIAKIDAKTGLISALRNGTAVVKASSNSSPNVFDTALVIVQNQIIEPESISLYTDGAIDSITINDGTLQLLVSTNPSDAIADVIWGISDDKTNIASVDTNGLVTAFRNGSVFVQATSTLVSTVGTKFEVFIANQVVEPTSLKILSERNASSIDINNGTLKLITEVTPKDAVNDVVWSIISEDADTASINEDGVLQAIRNGNVTVQAKSTVVDTLVATFDVILANQIVEPTRIEIASVNGSNLIDVNNGTLSLQVNVSPADADKNVNWLVYAADADTAKIDENGIVTAIRNGKATILAESKFNDNIFDGFEVEITNQFVEAESLYIYGQNDKREINVNKGTLQMLAIVNPLDTDDDVLWKIAEDDRKLASIDENGVLRAIDNGSVTVIGYYAEADTIIDEAEIAILNQYVLVSDINITAEGDATGIDTKGGTLQLFAEVLPDTAEYKDLEWKSSNEEVATVTNAGLVTAVADGTVLIIVSATDGSFVSNSISLSITNQTVGMKNELAAELSVFPNPTSTMLYVQNDISISKAELIYATGAVVDVTQELTKTNTINVSDLNAGIYVLRVVSQETTYKAVFIKK